MSQQWANYVHSTVAQFPQQFGITSNDASNFAYMINQYGQGANLACQSCMYNGTSPADCLSTHCGLTSSQMQTGFKATQCLDDTDCWGCAGQTPQAQYMCKNFTPHPSPPPVPPHASLRYDCTPPNPCPTPVHPHSSKEYIRGVNDTLTQVHHKLARMGIDPKSVLTSAQGGYNPACMACEQMLLQSNSPPSVCADVCGWQN